MYKKLKLLGFGAKNQNMKAVGHGHSFQKIYDILWSIKIPSEMGVAPLHNPFDP